MARIVFQSSQLSVRGTAIALYDYARYSREILGHDPVVAYNRNNPENNEQVIERFNKAFPVYGYNNFDEVDKIIEKKGIDFFYSIKAGAKDGAISRVVPSMIHAVFPVSPDNFHGAAYAFVSDWLSMYCSNRKVPAVPHIVELPDIQDSLRMQLGIPEAAMVFGCHGGAGSFDLDFVKSCVGKSVGARSDLYFLFLNIQPFIQHERVIFLPGTADLVEKVKFINSCDAMLHARKRGETFGLACGEFSLRNKPVLTYSRSGECNHIDILAESAFQYAGPRQLMHYLLELHKDDFRGKNWDHYSSRFSPEKIMRRFQDVFIDTAMQRGLCLDSGIKLDWVDRMAMAARRLDARLVKISRLIPR